MADTQAYVKPRIVKFPYRKPQLRADESGLHVSHWYKLYSGHVTPTMRRYLQRRGILPPERVRLALDCVSRAERAEIRRHIARHANGQRPAAWLLEVLKGL